MEALLTTFISVALAEIGDKTQLLAIALAVAYRRPAQLIAAIALAALASSLIGAAGGAIIHDMINLRAISLLVALALLYAGGSALFAAKPPSISAAGRTPAFFVAFVYLLAAEMGDKSQFLTAALAAQFDSFLLAGLGATAGILAATIPAVALAGEMGDKLPLRGLRIGIGVVFLVAGAIVAVNALRLV